MKLSKNTGRRGTIILSALLAAALLAVPQQKAEAKISSTGAAILGGVAGLAVGAAIADSRKPRTKIYYEGYAPPPPQGYAPRPQGWDSDDRGYDDPRRHGYKKRKSILGEIFDF